MPIQEDWRVSTYSRVGTYSRVYLFYGHLTEALRYVYTSYMYLLRTGSKSQLYAWLKNIVLKD